MKLKYMILSKITFGKTRKKYKQKLAKTNAYCIDGKNNKIFLLDDNEKIELKHAFPNLSIKIIGNDNEIIINKPELENNSLIVNIQILGNNNKCLFSPIDKGKWNISEYGDNNFMSVGENTSCGEFSIALHSNTFTIGHHCMISALEELWTDGHSVIDNNTKELLNYPKDPIIIGNHVWLGRRCTLTKGAQIPDDCIVGIGSIVTKKFFEPNCVIAGVPAKVVKKGINWDGKRPVDYFNEHLNAEAK